MLKRTPLLKNVNSFHLITVIVFLVAAVTINLIYYQNSKITLDKGIKEKMELLNRTISTAMQKSVVGEKAFEDLLGINLRTAAIAAKFALDPDVEKVSNEELVQLSKLLMVDQITLFKKTEDDIIGARSSDPKEINLSSKGWGWYYTAFNQLFDRKPVNVEAGQVLPNFWSPPMDTSTSNNNNVDKWGHYYDGTTNYIIDPFIHDKTIRNYQQLTGVDETLKKLQEGNKDFLLELAVLNTDKLLGEISKSDNQTDEWFSLQEALFGSYTYKDPLDIQYIQAAIKSNDTVFFKTEINGRKVIKSLTPIETTYLSYKKSSKNPLMLQITADYSVISSTLKHQLNETIGFMITVTVAIILIILFVLWLLRKRSAQNLQDVEAAYIDNIDNLFVSIREQRHDFNNHIMTLQTMITLNKFEELKEYTKSLVGEARMINETINIGNPALCALIQAKMAVATTSNINFEHEFKQMQALKLETLKSTDLVKILSNLIDNAFDATKSADKPIKSVKVTGEVLANQLTFAVSNTGEAITPELQSKIFTSGFTTKINSTNSGLGLSIVKKIVQKYKGSINLVSDESETTFYVTIPLH